MPEVMPGTSTSQHPSTRRGLLAVGLGTFALLVALIASLGLAFPADGRAAEEQLSASEASPTFTTGRPAASARLTEVMLHAADLGDGWFDVQRPNPTLDSSVDRARRHVDEAADARFVKSHRTAKGWTTEGTIRQHAYAFASEPAARVYLLRREAEAAAGCRCTQTWSTVERTPVVWTTARPTRRASFVVRETAFTIESGDTSAAVFSQAVQAAVRRALAA